MSGCYYGPYVSSDQPADCPYELYDREVVNGDPPVARVFRNNAYVDVTATVEDLGPITLTVDIYTVDCDGQPVAHTTSDELYHHWRVTLAGANPGETLYINDAYSGLIQATGTCAAPLEPDPTCSGMYDWSMCEGSGSGSGSDTNIPGDDDVGCNAGGAPGLAFGLLVLGLIVGRRSKRAR